MASPPFSPLPDRLVLGPAERLHIQRRRHRYSEGRDGWTGRFASCPRARPAARLGQRCPNARCWRAFDLPVAPCALPAPKIGQTVGTGPHDVGDSLTIRLRTSRGRIGSSGSFLHQQAMRQVSRRRRSSQRRSVGHVAARVGAPNRRCGAAGEGAVASRRRSKA